MIGQSAPMLMDERVWIDGFEKARTKSTMNFHREADYFLSHA
jgi:hypothetical protein